MQPFSVQSPAFRNKLGKAALERIADPRSRMLYHKSQLDLITIGNLTDNKDQISDCDWIIEVVVERLDVKKQVMNEIAKYRKKSVAIDINDPRGVEIVKTLIKQADVMLENNRPGTMKKFGLDYESVKDINPRLIYCSISAYGQTGPNALKPGYDMIAQARSGMMDYNGQPDQPPMPFSFVLGDYVTGLYASSGIAHALFHRERTGEGQYLDVAVMDSLVSINNNVEIYSTVGKFQRRGGRHNLQATPYGLFQGKNGQSAAITAPNEKLWAALLNAMGEDAVPLRAEKFVTMVGRMANRDELVSFIEGWLCKFDEIQDAVDLIEGAGVPASKVLNGAEMVNDPSLAERGMVVDFETPSDVTSVKAIKSRGTVIKMSKTPGHISRSPALGEHNEEVLTQYGFDAAYIAQLQAEWTARYSK